MVDTLKIYTHLGIETFNLEGNKITQLDRNRRSRAIARAASGYLLCSSPSETNKYVEKFKKSFIYFPGLWQNSKRSNNSARRGDWGKKLLITPSSYVNHDKLTSSQELQIRVACTIKVANDQIKAE